MLVDRLLRLKDRTNHLHFATDQIARWCHADFERSGKAQYRILDIGLGMGRDLLAVRRECAGFDLELYGVECQEVCIAHANQCGITTFPLNIERDAIPVPDEFFDVVISNHVVEHVKEIYWVFSEVSRVLRKGGIAIVGCPNLGSWHNRLALLCGRQPHAMQLLGAHVRGITKPGFRALIEWGGLFELVKYKGSNFYPFPPALNQALSALFPTLAASHHFLIRRTAKPGTFIEVLDSNIPGITDTPYYRGQECVTGSPSGA